MVQQLKRTGGSLGGTPGSLGGTGSSGGKVGSLEGAVGSLEEKTQDGIQKVLLIFALIFFIKETHQPLRVNNMI